MSSKNGKGNGKKNIVTDDSIRTLESGKIVMATFTFNSSTKTLSVTSSSIFTFALHCVNKSLSDLTLSSEISTNWETEEILCPDGSYRMLFRYKPSGTCSTGNFTDQKIFTYIGECWLLLYVDWNADTNDIGTISNTPIYNNHIKTLLTTVE